MYTTIKNFITFYYNSKIIIKIKIIFCLVFGVKFPKVEKMLKIRIGLKIKSLSYVGMI